MREDYLLKLAALSLSRMAQQGGSIRAAFDMRAFEEAMEAIGKPYRHPMISSEWHDFASDDAFGLMLVQDGQHIGGVAARVLDLGRDSLAEHWEASYRRLYPGVADPIRARVSAASEMRGRLVYQGELWVHPEWRGGAVNLSAAMYYLHVLSALKWRPDWIYGFVRIEGIRFVPSYGFTHQHVAAHRWLREVEGRGDNECLVSLTFRELCESAEYFTRNPKNFAPAPAR